MAWLFNFMPEGSGTLEQPYQGRFHGPELLRWMFLLPIPNSGVFFGTENGEKIFGLSLEPDRSIVSAIKFVNMEDTTKFWQIFWESVNKENSQWVLGPHRLFSGQKRYFRWVKP